MHRDALIDLEEWLVKPDRKPLVVRGARQVGKTWLIRELASRQGKRLLEFNFEREPLDAGLFMDRNPAAVVKRLEARFSQRIVSSEVVLFLDEIQAAPQVFANLWWFAEDMPELPVVAAGSLLDFVLSDHTFSMPVGRIAYLHLEGMSFDEFLSAVGEPGLGRFAEQFTWGEEIPDALHAQLLSRYREYVFVGGMPAAVAAWARDRSPMVCSEVQHRLISTFRDDFHKYRNRMPVDRLIRVFDAVPRMLGQKFVHRRVSSEDRSVQIKQALDLLCKARVCTRVHAAHGTGIPLGAEVREGVFKVLFLDVGLATAALGLSSAGVQSIDELALINGGALLEQGIGQALRGSLPRFMEPQLYYWAREQKGAEAEVDYLVQCATRIVPVEVKFGTTGRLKSLHLFMASRDADLAVRFNADKPSIVPVSVKTTSGQQAEYELFSLPFYLCGQMRRLVQGYPLDQ